MLTRPVHLGHSSQAPADTAEQLTTQGQPFLKQTSRCTLSHSLGLCSLALLNPGRGQSNILQFINKSLFLPTRCHKHHVPNAKLSQPRLCPEICSAGLAHGRSGLSLQHSLRTAASPSQAVIGHACHMGHPVPLSLSLLTCLLLLTSSLATVLPFVHRSSLLTFLSESLSSYLPLWGTMLLFPKLPITTHRQSSARKDPRSRQPLCVLTKQWFTSHWLLQTSTP